VQNVSFNVGGGDFAVMPSNARLQTGTPPAGSPNYFLSTELFLNALTIYKFHADWNRISLSTFTGPDTPLAATSWPAANVANAAQPGTATLLDVLQIRAMVQNQYTNFGGTESLWAPHTVRRGNTSGLAAPRWYQVNVTGGTVNANLPQATTWDPDGANVINRFMPSLALDRAGNMALGYTTSNGTAPGGYPSIKYAGRLSTDPVNTFSLTETSMFDGTASQTGVTNPPSTTRWGDYSAMTLDPNGCTFWYTNEYANPADQTSNHRWLTKFGSFQFSPCTTVGAGGTLQGTVFDSVTTNPISGATISFGSRTTTTNGSGFYSFTPLPAGTYPTETASAGGYNPGTTNTIVVTDSGTTVKDFALTAMSAGGCLVDTTQADFQLGVGTAVDLTTSPNDVTLSNTPTLDQQNTAGTTTGTGFGTPNWTGQTFIPAITGLLAKADVQLFCNGCGGTPPNLTLSVRNTSAGLPTGADLATATIPGSTFSSGAAVLFTATFGSPATLTSGTQYALILHPVSAPAGSGYFWIRSSPSTYANGSRVLSADSGGTWSTDTTRDFNFKTYMQTGYSSSGNLISGLKDNNPGGGFFGHWTTFSWTASTPANTSINFQVAGSNSQYGPFNFIGPDGTAGTFFNSSANLYPLLGNLRYMKYKAYLATTNSAATPTLNDVTVCYSNTNGPTAANGSVTGTITDGNGSPVGGVTINLSGTQSREAITDASGKYSFDSVETNGFYTVTPARANYTFTPANRSFSLLGVHTEASFTGTANNSHLNPLDTNEFFVRQHYLDFLGREPDGPGFAGWVSTLNNCAGGDASCDRVHVSEAFYFSQEFQERGYFAYRFYATALGRKPDYTEFAPDLARVSGFLTNDQLEAAKTAFIDDFMTRPAFARQYDSLNDTAFVDKLLQTSGVDLSSSRQGLIDALSTRRLSRAAVLRQIAESTQVYQKYYNQAFVVMEYFGYLHRDPDALYTDWIRALDANPADSRRMVDGFVNSAEYRNRFVP
jgi:hypothetical protein